MIMEVNASNASVIEDSNRQVGHCNDHQSAVERQVAALYNLHDETASLRSTDDHVLTFVY